MIHSVIRMIALKHVLIIALITVVQCNKYSKYRSNSETEKCTAGDMCEEVEDEPCWEDEEIEPNKITDENYNDGLYRWDPVEVDHVREIELEPNRVFKMITRAVKPPIFEIPNFLTPEECHVIINKTKEQGLFSSHVHMDPDAVEHEKKIKSLVGHATSPAGKFYNWDDNEDGLITIDEVISFAAENKYIYLTEDEVKEMITKLELTQFEDGVVTKEEFETLKTAAIESYFIERKKTHPRHRDRYSEQTWLRHHGDDFLIKLRRRVIELTKLPKTMVEGGEHLQVVHYDVNGHYHAHYDSQSPTQFPQFTCCHQNLKQLPDCRLCRYITILYYLNQPEEGGETAFPGADVPDFNETDFRERRNGDEYNLSHFCHRASLVVPPKQGTAIMWYNHHRHPSGWLGDLDYATLHGGCDIRKGEKWIANNWLTAPELGSQHILSDYYLEDDHTGE